VKVATWNVNGIRARYTEVLRWIDREEPDVICLQETKASPEHVPEPLLAIAGYHARWHGHKGYSGVALHLARSTFGKRPEFSHPDFDHETRIVTARAAELLFASVYVPNGGKDFAAKMRFLEAMVNYAARARAGGTTLVLCGDMNVARAEIDVHPKERKPRAIGQLPEERALFERLLSEGLVDVGRTLDPHNDALFTWWAPWRNMRQRNIGWRLDYVLASEGLAADARACPVLTDVGTSDHAPVVASFEGRG
jgi:exodeoxyribonuclease-3